MKKLILTLSAIIVSTAASQAFVDTQYMTTENFMQNTGYSKDAARMVAVTSKDPYREPYVESRKGKTLVKRVYNYLVPSTYTDLDFYNHSIDNNNPHWTDF